jgi:alkylation response protein AidB-like acyl-CoA dehydrogenase
MTRESIPLSPQLIEVAQGAAGDAVAALDAADLAGSELDGASHATILDALVRLGAIDLTVARVVEPHLDALLILREAGQAAPPGRYGVFAAESPGTGVIATESGGRSRLNGIKPWCSLPEVLDHALITASTPAGRRLFLVDLQAEGVRPCPSDWIARGLATVRTSDVEFSDAIAVPVGEPGWYLHRPGFAWGGIRVAACWAGATAALTQYLRHAIAARPSPDPIRLASLGRADVATWTATLALTAAAAQIDSGSAIGETSTRLAARVRAVVADAAETVLREVGHALGPAPLAFEEAHARRVADLTLYVRQHHAERDLAALAEELLEK